MSPMTVEAMRAIRTRGQPKSVGGRPLLPRASRTHNGALNGHHARRPSPADKRMLVKVHAASVNPLDWHYMRGEPYLMRAGAGIGAPENIHMGVDFAGTVVSVGKDVTRFKPGDEVFGGKGGAFGEYVSVAEKGSVAMKPANATFDQAAAVPIAAVTSLQALRDKGTLQPR